MTLTRCLLATASASALVVVVAIVVAIGTMVETAAPTGATPAPSARAEQRPEVRGGQRLEVRAAAVLRAWDVRRARAWAAGDPRALRRLYTSGSAAGRRDVVMLTAWSRRGLRVRGLRVQLLEVEVRVAESDRLQLRVADRLVGGWVEAGADRVRLPSDRRSRRTVELRRGPGDRTWRVHSVRSAQESPARSTAPTTRSRTS